MNSPPFAKGLPTNSKLSAFVWGHISSFSPTSKSGWASYRACLDVAMHNSVVMQVAESLQNLAGVETDGAFIVLQGSPH